MTRCHTGLLPLPLCLLSALLPSSWAIETAGRPAAFHVRTVCKPAVGVAFSVPYGYNTIDMGFRTCRAAQRAA